MWYVEKGTGNSWSDIDGYHNINHVIVNKTQDVSGYSTIEDFVQGESSGTSPLEVAELLEKNAMKALSEISDVEDMDNIELRETLGDIRSQAHFGLYWARKIRGGVALERYRTTSAAEQKELATTELERSLEEWKKYAAQLDASYEKVVFSRHDLFDWDALTEEVAKDIEIAREEP